MIRFLSWAAVLLGCTIVVLGMIFSGSSVSRNSNSLAASGGVTVDETYSVTGYAAVLSAYVDDNGMVNYRALKADRGRLDAFAAAMAALDPETFEKWPDEEKIAFWINAYNAFTLQAIIDHYPIKASVFKSLVYPRNSIRQIDGVWDELEFSVLGKVTTLDHIEHGVLRKEFDEPRIHMALVCAAMGCPPLREEPYVVESLDAQLDDQTRRFLANPAKFRIDRRKGKVFLSSIFKWFGEDFVGTYGTNEGFSGHDENKRAVLNFISGYLGDEDRDYLSTEQYDIEYLDYDWSLNEQS